MRDEDVAERLGSVRLSEQLTDRTLADLCSEKSLGPQTCEQLALLATASVLRDPPRPEQPDLPFPDAAQQMEWIDRVVAFANGNLRRLPDFLATRVTRVRQCSSSVQAEARATHDRLHPVGEFHREIAYRNGREEQESGTREDEAGARLTEGGRTLSSWGEFGPVLTTVLGDAFAGSVRFLRWDAQRDGSLAAVLHFAVPRVASHYLVDFCCYQVDEESAWLKFRDTPGYHGDIYFDPQLGTIVRMRLETDLQETDPVAASGIAVDYGPVQIGGKEYICPIKSVAILTVHNLEMKKIDGEGLMTHLNETRFLGYRRFGSTTRVLPATGTGH